MISLSSLNSLPPALPLSVRSFSLPEPPQHLAVQPPYFAKTKRCLNANSVRVPALSSAGQGSSNDDADDRYQVLTAMKSTYNEIIIIDTPKSRMLLLDSTHNVHSIINKEEKWTGYYWDEFATLPAIVPPGPIAILGLGAGTAAHLMLDVWPSLQLEGWEIDEILIDKAREYFGLSELEKRNQNGGILNVHIGDALSPSVDIPGGYSGIVVDLFSEGKVLPQLKEVKTWLGLKHKLMPNGRIMVNCAGADNETSVTRSESNWEHVSTIKAIFEAFHGQLSWKKLSQEDGENYLALTGSFPDLTTWSATVPDRLSSCIVQWIN